MRTIKSSPDERIDMLDAFPMFGNLADADKRALADTVLIREYGANELLFMQDGEAAGFFGVLSGKVKIHRVGNDGREQVLHLFGRGELCGEVPVFQGRVFPASAMAVSKARVVYVPRVAFLDLARKRPELLLGMLAMLSHRLRGFVNLVDDLSLKEVSARLAKYLLDRQVRKGSDTVELDSTKAVLAARLGTIAETISRTLNRMQKRGVIEVNGRSIRVLDRDALTALAAGMKL
ncbi:MAG: Crp/Fnr family transcriptional regulator [bacterium]|nr:Crp/Fnr family transcriptional regulator [bacterium]